jgi:hypothetical protein
MHLIRPVYGQILSSPEEFREIELFLAAAQGYFSPSSAEFAQIIIRDDLAYSVELQEFER